MLHNLNFGEGVAVLIGAGRLYLLEGEVLNRANFAVEVDIAGIAAAQLPYSLVLALKAL